METFELLYEHLVCLWVIAKTDGVVDDKTPRETLAVFELVGGPLARNITSMR